MACTARNRTGIIIMNEPVPKGMTMICKEARRLPVKRGMAGLWITLSLAITGCSYGRPVPVVEVAPDPVMYPAPSAGGRYIPWASGLASGETVFLGPFGRAVTSRRPPVIE